MGFAECEECIDPVTHERVRKLTEDIDTGDTAALILNYLKRHPGLCIDDIELLMLVIFKKSIQTDIDTIRRCVDALASSLVCIKGIKLVEFEPGHGYKLSNNCPLVAHATTASSKKSTAEQPQDRSRPGDLDLKKA